MRASWGQTGNQDIPSFSNIAEYNIIDGNGNLRTVYGNKDLIWETTTQTNVGIDFSLFDYRLYGNFDLFNKVTNDLLFRTTAAAAGLPGGLSRVWINSPTEITSKGIEFLVGGYPVSKENFTWDISVNLTAVNTTIANLPSRLFTGGLGGEGLSSAAANVYEEGQELAFYLFDFERFDSDDQVVFGNNSLKAANKPVAPDFTFGINTSVQAGNFDMTMSWTGASGLYVYNNTASSNISYFHLGIGGNTIPHYIETQPARFNAGLAASDFYLEKADYIRLNNLQIGYSFNVSNLRQLSKARVYLAGQNLLLFTGYLGYDPEVNDFSPIDGIPSYGIDYSVYPKARTFSLGVNISF